MLVDKKEQDYIKEQNTLKQKIDLKNLVDLKKIRMVAGVDLAYWKSGTNKKEGSEAGSEEKEYAVCCIVVLDYCTHKVVEQTSFAKQMEVPYIPGCLAYREIPVFLEAYKQLKMEPEVLFFDGNGYLHPRHMGLATHAGILLNKASVGVAKTYYKVGNVDFIMPEDRAGASTDIVVGEEVYGRVLRTHQGVKPVIVSVGNRIDMDTAVQMAMALTEKESHIPLPTRLADLMTHKERRRILK